MPARQRAQTPGGRSLVIAAPHWLIVAMRYLVIAVDTAVIHLAGAMGKPVWTLLPFCARLAVDAETRRQPLVSIDATIPPRPRGNWEAVIAKVAEELSRYPSSLHE